MLIGIHGKKKHGKDELAKINQFLIFQSLLLKSGKTLAGHDKSLPLKIFCGWKEDVRFSYSTWKKKMFAEKLKQIVCMLIGCKMEDLENQDFKEKELGEEWRVWYLWDSFEERRYKTLYLNAEEARINNPFNYYSVKSYVLTPRLLLQLIGTEGGRNLVHPNIWINATMVDYKPVQYHDGGEFYDKGEYPNWQITDVRFENEVEAVRKRGGIVIKIFRPGMDDNNQHESETALDHMPDNWFDGYILNNGVNDFQEVIKEQAESILHYHKII